MLVGGLTISPRFAGLLDAICRTLLSVQGEGVEQFSRDARTGQRIPEGFAADGDQICARTQEVIGVTAALYPTHPDDGNPNAPPYLRNLCKATARTAGPDTPPVFPPSHGSPGRCGCGAIPRSVLINETASAPCCLGRRGDVRRRRRSWASA